MNFPAKIVTDGAGDNAPFGPAGRLPPIIPDFTLLHQIGRGSYGEVWLARSILGELRAIKVVYQRVGDDSRLYKRELAGIQKFEPISRSHPGYVAILHAGSAPGLFYYVMELADDGGADPGHYTPRTLQSELRAHGPFSAEECLTIALGLTLALEDLHSRDLVHRDLKPSNIIFVNGQPKLADVGLITSADATFSFVGTEGYVPPEGPGTSQADIYSLGKVLYELSTGRDRHDFPALPLDLRTRSDAALFVELNAVMVRACSSHPNGRYRSATEMRRDLESIAEGKSVRRFHAWRRLRRTWTTPVAAILLVILLTFALTVFIRQPTPTGIAPYDLAVLRYQPNEQNAWERDEPTERLGAGISDAFQQIDGFTVAPNKYRMRFTNDPPDLSEIRSLTTARHVLLLRLDKSNQAFQVTAALRRGERERAIWSASYTGNKTNLAEIGASIVTNLDFAMQLNGGPSLIDRAQKRMAANFEALNLYRRAWEPWRNDGTRESYQSAIHAANDAIQLATNYVDAYLRLGNIYRHLAAFARDPKETMVLQERIARQALEIDDTHPQTYSMLGGIKVLFDWDFAEGERLIRRAVELEPARWNGNLPFFLRCMGRLAEARVEAARGIRINPEGHFEQSGWICQMRLERRFPEALAAAKKFRAQQPNASFCYLHLGLIYYDMEDYEQAVTAVQQGIQLQADPELLGLLGAIYADMGKTNEARAVLLDLDRIAANAYANPYFFAGVYAALAENDQAFRYLDKAAEARSENLVNAEYGGLHNDKRLDRLRGDPRFAEILRRVGLPPWPQQE